MFSLYYLVTNTMLLAAHLVSVEDPTVSFFNASCSSWRTAELEGQNDIWLIGKCTTASQQEKCTKLNLNLCYEVERGNTSTGAEYVDIFPKEGGNFYEYCHSCNVQHGFNVTGDLRDNWNYRRLDCLCTLETPRSTGATEDMASADVALNVGNLDGVLACFGQRGQESTECG